MFHVGDMYHNRQAIRHACTGWTSIEPIWVLFWHITCSGHLSTFAVAWILYVFALHETYVFICWGSSLLNRQSLYSCFTASQGDIISAEMVLRKGNDTNDLENETIQHSPKCVGFNRMIEIMLTWWLMIVYAVFGHEIFSTQAFIRRIKVNMSSWRVFIRILGF